MKRITHEKDGIVIYKSTNGSTTFEIDYRGDTLWLSLDQVAKVFDRDKSVISRHFHNIFSSGELNRDSVVAKKATTAADGTNPSPDKKTCGNQTSQSNQNLNNTLDKGLYLGDISRRCVSWRGKE